MFAADVLYDVPVNVLSRDPTKQATDRAWQAGKQEAEKQNLTEEASFEAAERLIDKTEALLQAGRQWFQPAGAVQSKGTNGSRPG